MEVTCLNLVLVRIWKEEYSDKTRIPANLLAYLLTLIVNELKISVGQGRVVKIINIFRH